MNMEYFNALVQDRKEIADMLEKPSMKGVKSSVIDKYSAQAHFIYELLQNADDTKATYARFKLYHDKLVFAHNGERHFSISSPDNEEQDRENGRLGDVNAILSIGNSSKTSESTIGKFGVGFKAVFQYTSTPYIYDPEICFKIDRFIVPVLLESDYPERKAEETLFVFPFDHKVNTPDKAFDAIEDRLCSLVNPLLFLSHLQKIDFEFDDTNGSYQKENIKEYHFDSAIAECINLSKIIDDKREEAKLWLFSRTDENGRRYSVGFFLDKNGKLYPVQQCAYCFFPTRETIGLNFIIHAPFLLTDSREGIKAGNEHNKRMIDLLAELAADSLTYLRDIGNEEGVRLIDDNILDIIPTKSLHKRGLFGSTESEFEPFYEKILDAFQSKMILPTKNAYTIAENAYWAYNHAITSVFDEETLQALMNDGEAHWVFIGLPREKSQNKDYINNIVGNKYVDEDKILRKINPVFIESRSIEWLSEFYNWIDETSNRTKKFRVKPIFLDSKGKAVPAYDDEGKLVLFLPTGENNDYTTVNEKLWENEDIKAFLNSTIRITKPALKNEIYNKILPKFEKGDKFDSKADFKKLFEYYMNECPPAEQDGYISALQKYDIVCYTTAAKKRCYRGSCKKEKIYFPTEELKEYFIVIPSTKFVTMEDYIELVGKENEKSLHSFLIKLGVSEELQFIIRSVPEPMSVFVFGSLNDSKHSDKWSEKVIDGCSENINFICTEKNVSRSTFFWNRIVDFISKENIDLNNKLWKCHEYYYYKSRKEYSDSDDMLKFRASKWLCTKSGEFVSPSETYADALAEGYDVSTSAAIQFIKFLKMPLENPELSRLSPEQREDIEIARKIKEAGISDEELDEMIAMHQQSKHSFKNPYESVDYENSSNILYGNNRVEGEGENLITTTYKPQKTNHTIDTDNIDFDEYMPKLVDYKKKIERAKLKSDAELVC